MIKALLSNPPIADNMLMASLLDVPKLGFVFELALCIYSYHGFLNLLHFIKWEKTHTIIVPIISNTISI